MQRDNVMINPEKLISTHSTNEPTLAQMHDWLQEHMRLKPMRFLRFTTVWPYKPVTENAPERPEHQQKKQPKWRQQEKAILAAITSLGHDPERLPKINAGKRGVKDAVKKSLAGNDLFAAKTAFKKAWDGLLSDSKIARVK